MDVPGYISDRKSLKAEPAQLVARLVFAGSFSLKKVFKNTERDRKRRYKLDEYIKHIYSILKRFIIIFITMQCKLKILYNC